ncbi:MAG: OmpH family outer membrane protein [Saprospiraceae bacterium]|nr:OmpH family outer membrane protein [Saprospiraceae bacterium]
MKRILKLSTLIIAMVAMVSAVQAQKFGYVNSQEILAGMAEVKQADANLEALQKQLQKKGQGMVEQLQKDYLAIQQKVERGELSPKQQEEEGQKLEARQQEIAKFEQDMVNQIQTKRASELKPISDKINKAIADVAKENGFQFIFDQGILLYAESAQDVSSLVKAKLGM